MTKYPRVLGLGGSKTFQISANANEAKSRANSSPSFLWQEIFVSSATYHVIHSKLMSPVYTCFYLLREKIDIFSFLASMYETCIYFILILKTETIHIWMLLLSLS
jgi:hypothetical protein